MLRIKRTDGLLADEMTEVYANDGSQLQASSVAVYHPDTAQIAIETNLQSELHLKRFEWMKTNI